MKYETLKLEIVSIDGTDVITTSGEVTTESITMPWQTSRPYNLTSFEPMFLSEKEDRYSL